ncbi:hypothetical protein BJ165DRAFT_1553607 [Panaeolus papilionaceus]|nr:hypothetical protein BJ165DRAFT_1553607 [Panaeolus papilionaceus]
MASEGKRRTSAYRETELDVKYTDGTKPHPNYRWSSKLRFEQLGSPVQTGLGRAKRANDWECKEGGERVTIPLPRSSHAAHLERTSWDKDGSVGDCRVEDTEVVGENNVVGHKQGLGRMSDPRNRREITHQHGETELQLGHAVPHNEKERAKRTDPHAKKITRKMLAQNDQEFIQGAKRYSFSSDNKESTQEVDP